MLHIVLCPTTVQHLALFKEQMQYTSVPCQYTTLLPSELLQHKDLAVGKLLVYRPSNFLATFSYAIHTFATKTLVLKGQLLSTEEFTQAFASEDAVALIQDAYVAAVDLRPPGPEVDDREGEKLCGVVYDTEALIGSLETFYPEASSVKSNRYEPNSISALDNNWEYYGIHV